VWRFDGKFFYAGEAALLCCLFWLEIQDKKKPEVQQYAEMLA